MHAIIIAHRNRNADLEHCVRSIQHSADLCGVREWRIVLVDNGSAVPPKATDFHLFTENLTIIPDTTGMTIFNKPALQNRGIEESQDADVLTFLDGDSLVGLRWMDNVQRLIDDSALTKLCYRVRYIDRSADLTNPPFFDYDKAIRVADKMRDIYSLAREGYGRPEHFKECPGPIFGNSQFSIRREVLGDTRFNEQYVGRGFEDLWMNRELWMRNPEAYRAEIVTDATHAMFHIKGANDGGPDWFNAGLNAFNARQYRGSWRGMQKLLPLPGEKQRGQRRRERQLPRP